LAASPGSLVCMLRKYIALSTKKARTGKGASLVDLT